METRYRSNNATRNPKRFTSVRKAKKAFKEYRRLPKERCVTASFNEDVIKMSNHRGGLVKSQYKTTFGVYFSVIILVND